MHLFYAEFLFFLLFKSFLLFTLLRRRRDKRQRFQQNVWAFHQVEKKPTRMLRLNASRNN